MMNNSILWLGSVPSVDVVGRHLAVNEASRKWQKGLLTGLLDVGVGITVLGHRYEQCWPRGLLFPGRMNELDDSFESHLVRYLNFPGLRFPVLGYSYYLKARRILRSKPYSYICTYNPYPWHVSAARRLKREFGIKWLSFTLDYDDVGVDWEDFLSQTQEADAHVFASYFAAQECPVHSKLHLDCGLFPDEIVTREHASSSCRPRRLVYAGSLGEEAGFSLLIDAFKLLPPNQYTLDVCGKVSDYARKVTHEVSGVTLHGFVGDARLCEICCLANVLVNPRPSSMKLNEMVFPSKLMDYMKYLKPVVSTLTPGLSPEYSDYIYLDQTSSASGVAAQIERVGSLQNSELNALRDDMRQFLLEHKTWREQALKLKHFMGFNS